MAIRPTQQRTTEMFIGLINDKRLELEKIRTQLSTGVKVSTASEAGGKAGTIISLQNALTRIDKHKERISFSSAILQHQESVLEQANNLMVRAEELANQGANGTVSAEGRALIAKEVFQIRDQLAALGNTTFQGRYIYGGADDDDEPFDAQTYTVPASSVDADAAKRYVFDGEDGTDITRTVPISDTDTVQIVTSGSDVFSNAIGFTEKLGRALLGYRTTQDGTTGLPTGAGTAYTQPTDYPEQTNDILVAMTGLKTSRTNDIVQERSSVGSRIARLEQVSEILDSLKITTESSRAEIQDTNVVEASATFANLQTALQALMASGVQINNVSLLNYL